MFARKYLNGPEGGSIGPQNLPVCVLGIAGFGALFFMVIGG